MRADARRNRNAVLEAGARLLAERPTASMQEIADASGVGRTTVYRHFPAREDLVAALIEQVAAELVQVTESAVAGGGPAAGVLGRLATEVIALGRRWSFLRAQRDVIAVATRSADETFAEWIAVKQGRGEIRRDVDATWMQEAVRGLLGAGVDATARLGHGEAARMVPDTRVSAFVAR